MLSEYFVVRQGVRQGGVLSPFLFNVYVDELLNELEMNGIGCHVCNQYFGCIMYADDLLLLSASVSGLQHMLEWIFVTDSVCKIQLFLTRTSPFVSWLARTSTSPLND